MNDIITDLLAIIGVVLNGLPQGLLALAYGFASVPTALAFFVGAIGNTVTQSVAPISFQAETITYAGTAGKNRSERCTMIFIGGAVMALIGAFGLLTKTVDFIGEDVAYGMMAGVGIILTKAAIDMIKSDKISGGVSLAAALITYFIIGQIESFGTAYPIAYDKTGIYAVSGHIRTCAAVHGSTTLCCEQAS